MKSWSNIQISPRDPEIVKINNLEKDLKLQVCTMDICHYAFPVNIDLLLQGIGAMKPVKKIEGCGSFNESIKTFIEKEFSILNKMINLLASTGKSDKNENRFIRN